MIGSNWPPPLQAHSGFDAPHVAPPSLVAAANGELLLVYVDSNLTVCDFF